MYFITARLCVFDSFPKLIYLLFYNHTWFNYDGFMYYFHIPATLKIYFITAHYRYKQAKKTIIIPWTVNDKLNSRQESCKVSNRPSHFRKLIWEMETKATLQAITKNNSVRTDPSLSIRYQKYTLRAE